VYADGEGSEEMAVANALDCEGDRACDVGIGARKKPMTPTRKRQRLLVAFVLLAAVGAIVLYMRANARRPDAAVVDAMFARVAAAQREHGVDELKKLGCNAPAITTENRGPGLPSGRIIVCGLVDGAKAPTCEAVAAAYSASLDGGIGPLTVAVRDLSSRTTLCQLEVSGLREVRAIDASK
jgi:hypothetical protein